MKNRALEKKLGVDPGASLTALIELAERVSPSPPWNAFAPLWLHFPWLKQGASAASAQRFSAEACRQCSLEVSPVTPET